MLSLYFFQFLYRVIFGICIFSPTTLWTVSPHLEFPQKKLCLKKHNLNIVIRSAFACWHESEKKKPRRGEYFPIYSIFKGYFNDCPNCKISLMIKRLFGYHFHVDNSSWMILGVKLYYLPHFNLFHGPVPAINPLYVKNQQLENPSEC